MESTSVSTGTLMVIDSVDVSELGVIVGVALIPVCRRHQYKERASPPSTIVKGTVGSFLSSSFPRLKSQLKSEINEIAIAAKIIFFIHSPQYNKYYYYCTLKNVVYLLI